MGAWGAQLHSEEVGWTQLRLGTSALVHATSTRWPEGEDDELWSERWVPLVVDWTELLTSALPVSAYMGAAASLRRSAGSEATSLNYTLGGSCCSALCIGTSRARREHVVEFLANRAAASAARLIEDSTAQLQPLLGVATSLGAVLSNLPHTPPLRAKVVGRVVSSVRAILALASMLVLRQADATADAQDAEVAVVLCVAATARGLYAHLAVQQLRPNRGPQDPHHKLGEAESLLLHVASLQARLALPSWPQRDTQCPDRESTKSRSLAPLTFSRLCTSTYDLMSALFSSVPSEGTKLPGWTQKPHIVVGVLQAMLEEVYAAPSGAQASAIAADTTRLWEAFVLGGTRMMARSAGRAGQSSFQAKVQRATQSFAIFLIAHALEQQRRWAGVDAAVQRCLLQVAPNARSGARANEAALWREASEQVQVGMGALLDGLEGADHFKQGLYVSLREPLNTMFKELHEGFQQRTKYRGEA